MRPESEFLTALTGKIKRRKFVVFDIESKKANREDPTEPGFERPFLVGFFDGYKYEPFRNGLRRADQLKAASLISDYWFTHQHLHKGGCVDSFLRFYLRPEYARTVCYAHNGGTFDHLHLLPWLVEHTDEFGFEVVPIQSSIIKVTVFSKMVSERHRSRYSWTLLDSMRLMPMSLQKSAKAFGFEGKSDLDLATPEEDLAWERYNERDCRQLYQVVEKFHDLVENELQGEVGLTAPATAMKIYRRKFMGSGSTPSAIPRHKHFDACDTEVNGPCTEGCLHQFIRSSYCGGRSEVFRSHGKGLYYYDINSSYPASMRLDMPAGDKFEKYGATLAEIEELHHTHIGFIECEVTIPDDCYLPPLPHRREEDGKLIFPVGTFSGIWDYDELQLLHLVGGTVNKVRRTVWYRRKQIFLEFVTELYKFRDKSRPDYNEGLGMVAKLMLNSLYGKFGMNPQRRKLIVLQKGETPPNGAIAPSLDDNAGVDAEISSPVWYLEEEISADYIIPQISAHITALSRILLYRTMHAVLQAGYQLYYTDTDSILTDCPTLPVGNELGALKLVYSKVDGEFFGPKTYWIHSDNPLIGEHIKGCKSPTCPGCLVDKVAAKGLPASVRTVENLRLLNQGGKVKFERLEKVGSFARRNFVGPPKLVTVTKSSKSLYDKRIVLPDGNTRAIKL